jgi:hypothetical protein
MKKACLVAAVCACTNSFISLPALSVAVPDQGAWKTMLEAGDSDGDTRTIEGHHDTVLDTNWLADVSHGIGWERGVHDAWAVHDGDVGEVVIPIPPSVWLFSSALLGIVAIARRKGGV